MLHLLPCGDPRVHFVQRTSPCFSTGGGVGVETGKVIVWFPGVGNGRAFSPLATDFQPAFSATALPCPQYSFPGLGGPGSLCQLADFLSAPGS